MPSIASTIKVDDLEMPADVVGEIGASPTLLAGSWESGIAVVASHRK